MRSKRGRFNKYLRVNIISYEWYNHIINAIIIQIL